MPAPPPSGPPVEGRGRTRRAVAAWFNRFLASDPGLTRLRTALQTTSTVGAALLAEWMFFRAFSPLTVPPEAQGADVLNRAALVMAMMAGAMVAMISSFVAPMHARVWKALLALLLLPAAMTAGVAVALVLDPFPVLAVVVMVAILGGSGFLRRFGAYGFVVGQGLFMGDFLGFFLSRVTDVSGIGWIAAELGIGTAVAVVVYLVTFSPNRMSAVKRLRSSFLRRADRVAATTLDVLDHPGSATAGRRAHQQLIRFNEAALMIDAQLAESPRLPVGTTASQLHSHIFSAELSLANAARFARTIVTLEVPDEALELVREAMRRVRAREPERLEQAGRRLRAWLSDADNRERAGIDATVVLHRYATSVLDYGEVEGELRAHRFASSLPRRRHRPAAPVDAFEPAVELAGGWLPGSSGVSATASKEGAARPASARMHPSVRLGIQMTIAGATAVVVGTLISPDRFSWAVIAAFVTFMGANNAAEQVRKGAFRVIGTVAGVIVGSALAIVVGDHPAVSIGLILVSLFVGVYMMRVSYAVFTAALTVLIAQLYVQLAEFSTGLLDLRLLETVAGAAAAVLTVIFVLPLRTSRVVRVATREFVDALGELVGPAILRLRDVGYDEQLRTATRDLDAAFQALEAATAPSRGRLRVPGTLGGEKRPWWFAANAAHSFARSLVGDTRRIGRISGETGDELAEAGQVMLSSMNALSRGLGEHATKRTYIRSASRFERVAAELDDHDRVTLRQLALRDLQLIDGALANLAQAAGIAVRSLDAGAGDER